MEKEGPLFERSEFRAFPFFVLHKRVPPSGGDDAWAAFLAHLFGETKRWVAAGLPPAGNLKIRAQVFENQICKQFESEINIHSSMLRTPLDSSQKHAGMTPLEIRPIRNRGNLLDWVGDPRLHIRLNHYADFVIPTNTNHQDPIPALYYPPPHP